MTDVVVEDLRAEHVRGPALGIGEPLPRLSWITVTEIPGWAQAAYELELDGVPLGRTPGEESVLVAWPGEPLRSRSAHRVRVPRDTDASASPRLPGAALRRRRRRC